MFHVEDASCCVTVMGEQSVVGGGGGKASPRMAWVTQSQWGPWKAASGFFRSAGRDDQGWGQQPA